ncbi:hypothetical protein ACV37H_29855, partial [Pseudomonas aeruginosa]
RRPPGRGWQRLQVWLPPLALLLLWQSASSAEWVDPAILASPLEVARATWSGALDGSLPGATGRAAGRRGNPGRRPAGGRRACASG